MKNVLNLGLFAAVIVGALSSLNCGQYYTFTKPEIERGTFKGVKFWVTKGKHKDGITLRLKSANGQPVFIDWGSSSLTLPKFGRQQIIVYPDYSPNVSMVRGNSVFYIQPANWSRVKSVNGRKHIVTVPQLRKSNAPLVLNITVCIADLEEGVTPDRCQPGGEGWFVETIRTQIYLSENPNRVNAAKQQRRPDVVIPNDEDDEQDLLDEIEYR